MKSIILLSGDEPVLVEGELKGSVVGESAEILERQGRIALISEREQGLVFNRMGYARMWSKYLASGSLDDVVSSLSSFELPEGRYAVRATRYGEFSGRTLDVENSVGYVIGKKRKIDLTNPEVIVDIYLGEKVYAGIRMRDTRGIPERQPTKRPFFSPVTLHPKMARALINLTGIERGRRILDPFSGTGAILVEAGLMGLHPIGTDLDPDMVEGARRNMRHYGIKGEVSLMDIDGIRDLEGIDAISTDPPYGRSSTTNKEPVETLYKRAFEASADVLRRGKRMSVILPSEDYIELADAFRILEVYPVKVHRSLTRYFYALERS